MQNGVNRFPKPKSISPLEGEDEIVDSTKNVSQPALSVAIWWIRIHIQPNFLNFLPTSLTAIQCKANDIVALFLHLQIRISYQETIYARLSRSAKTGPGRGKDCLLFKIFAIACITLITITKTPNATTPIATPVLQLRVLSLI